MSRTYEEFCKLMSAYNEADEKWMPIQKAYELLDGVNENEIWEQRHAAADALYKYIAELESLVERLIEAGDRLSDSLCTYPEEEKTIEVCNWKAVVDKVNKERER